MTIINGKPVVLEKAQHLFLDEILRTHGEQVYFKFMRDMYENKYISDSYGDEYNGYVVPFLMK